MVTEGKYGWWGRVRTCGAGWLVGWLVGWMDGEVVWEMWPFLGRDRKYCWWIGSWDSRSEECDYRLWLSWVTIFGVLFLWFFSLCFLQEKTCTFRLLEILHDSSFIIIPNFFPNLTVIVAGIDTVCRKLSSHSAVFRQNVNTSDVALIRCVYQRSKHYKHLHTCSLSTFNRSFGSLLSNPRFRLL